MTNTETIQAIRNEIERRMKVMLSVEGLVTGVADNMRYQDYKSLLSFLSTLESEKPMQEGLEEELDRFIASGKSVTVDDYGTYKVSYHDFKKIARHFAEWQKEQDDRLVDIIYQQGIEKGKDDMRETLKKEEEKMNEVPHPGFDKPEEYETFTTTNDLQEYASRAGFDYVDNIVQEHPGHRFNDHDVEYAYRDGIIAGAKWQAEQLLKSSPLPEDTVIYQKGVEEGKMLMMEEAVEGEVMLNPYPTICLDDCKNYDFKDGDKVRVIVCKKED